MNSDALTDPNDLTLTPDQKEEVRRLAAVGMSPAKIAVGIELRGKDVYRFRRLAEIPDSEVAMLIREGEISGVAIPQIKMQQAAAAGNLDAIKQLREVQADNEFQQLLNNMDDDELPFFEAH